MKDKGRCVMCLPGTDRKEPGVTRCIICGHVRDLRVRLSPNEVAR